MVEINFVYNGINTVIQSKMEDKLKEICQQFGIKLKIDTEKLIFIYGGEILNLDLELNQVLNQIDKVNNKMNILEYNRNSTIISNKN